MKKIACIFLVILLLAGLTAAVSARSGADTARYEATVHADGSCQVRFSMTLTLDSAVKELYFPLPEGATDATVNGAAALIHAGKGISLSGIASKPGTYSITIGYTLPGVVEVEGEAMTLALPLLSGFAYPLDSFTFAVTLPDDLPKAPTFSSGYHQETIAEHLTVTVSGPTVYGSAKAVMKDHETLVMTLPVDETLFPQTADTVRLMRIMEYIAWGLLGLAILYYLLAMLPRLRRPHLRATAPAGFNAGEAGLWLNGRPLDFPMMVISWAQMGYLRIQKEGSGRILLYKRMEMGNERSAVETKFFSLLFHRRKVVDATGDHFAKLHRAVAHKKSRLKDVFGLQGYRYWVFFALCLISAGIFGFVMGGSFHPTSILVWVLLTLTGLILGLLIHRGGMHLICRRRSPVWIGLGAAVVWLVLGILCGKFLAALGFLVLQLLLSVVGPFGGSRTPQGDQRLMELIELWLYLLMSDRKQLQKLLKRNPDYFHTVAPFALALNADRLFARRFGKLQMPECTYLQCGRDRHLTAQQFSETLRKTVDAMDAKAKRLPLDRLMGR